MVSKQRRCCRPDPVTNTQSQHKQSNPAPNGSGLFFILHRLEHRTVENYNTKPHFNTVWTFVRSLETSGMVSHIELGPKFFQYKAAMTREKYAEMINRDSVQKLFAGSYMDFMAH